MSFFSHAETQVGFGRRQEIRRVPFHRRVTRLPRAPVSGFVHRRQLCRLWLANLDLRSGTRGLRLFLYRHPDLPSTRHVGSGQGEGSIWCDLGKPCLSCVSCSPSPFAYCSCALVWSIWLLYRDWVIPTSSPYTVPPCPVHSWPMVARNFPKSNA